MKTHYDISKLNFPMSVHHTADEHEVNFNTDMFDHGNPEKIDTVALAKRLNRAFLFCNRVDHERLNAIIWVETDPESDIPRVRGAGKGQKKTRIWDDPSLSDEDNCFIIWSVYETAFEKSTAVATEMLDIYKTIDANRHEWNAYFNDIKQEYLNCPTAELETERMKTIMETLVFLHNLVKYVETAEWILPIVAYVREHAKRSKLKIFKEQSN